MHAMAEVECAGVPSDDEQTRLSTAEGDGHPGGTSLKAGSASSGWLTSSDAIDHGRFPPGTLLGGRYRVVERLGRGGMGEVYRADDLKLAQPVALKFLPAEVDHDPARLMQLHSEVRMARQVSHPNVCRVYDIDEVDGHTFLSMEYVDGEELGSLLRRIGRFSVERSLEISRQICAGLAAAHERGVVHRDLKPANVMVDGDGKARITDFGLAGTSGETIRAGTPAYMAPEQLAGAEVTAQSDIYSLGLVLYELFTGQRAIEAKNIAELVRKREAGVVPPSELVRDLDPAIDRAILRCLERDPIDRPSSALGVAAALPGGDPLAAALAAGETPSPEMVAAAGPTSALRPATAAAGLVFTLCCLAGYGVTSDRVLLTSTAPMPKPPEVLIDRAQQVAEVLGYTDVPIDRASGFDVAGDFLRFVPLNSDARAMQDHIRTGTPAAILFWYRTSPRQLIPAANNERVTLTDPPSTVTNMRTVVLDASGRLVAFSAVPPQLEDPPPAASGRIDWQAIVQLTGLELAHMTPATPQWTPNGYAEQRMAWEGAVPGWPQEKVRLEAAAYRGRATFLKVIYPWTQPEMMRESSRTPWERFAQSFVAVIVLVVLAVAALVARHNLRKGRGDRRGALRIWTAILAAMFFALVVSAKHPTDFNQELDRIFTMLGWSLFCASAVWLLYLALEPYVRRFWPTTLISWSRFVAGNVLDPQVGRDVLIGVGLATFVVLLGHVAQLVRPRLGYPAVFASVPNLNMLLGFRQTLAMIAQMLFSAAFNTVWIVFGLVAVNLLTRRVWVTGVVMALFLMLTGLGNYGQTQPMWLNLAMGLTTVGLVVLVMLRFGLLATLTFFLAEFLLNASAITLDPGKWFFPASTLVLLIVASLGAYGFYASRGGEPLLGRRIFD
jgi:serine/threonine-protein kinase